MTSLHIINCLSRFDTCPRCGGVIMGDGSTIVRHCENAPDTLVHEAEPDANVVLCEDE